MSEQTSFCAHRPLPKPKLTRECYDEDWNLKSEQEIANEVARLREELQEYKDTQITFTLALLENKDLQIARLRGIITDHAKFLRNKGYRKYADDLMRHALKAEIK